MHMRLTQLMQVTRQSTFCESIRQREILVLNAIASDRRVCLRLAQSPHRLLKLFERFRERMRRLSTSQEGEREEFGPKPSIIVSRYDMCASEAQRAGVPPDPAPLC
jgi:hypothetical protein